MVLVASPGHPLGAGQGALRDLGDGALRRASSVRTTAQKIMRLFEQHGTRCRVVAELWSFENMKSFVQAEGPRHRAEITVQQDLADGTLARIHVAELNMPRRTLMIYREHGHLADPARELIKIVQGLQLERRNGARRARHEAPAGLSQRGRATDHRDRFGLSVYNIH